LFRHRTYHRELSPLVLRQVDHGLDCVFG
jgi:hypothetical protein